LELVLVNTGSAAAIVSSALVFPTGFSLTLTVLLQDEEADSKIP
jgi:hypothetical protein